MGRKPNALLEKYNPAHGTKAYRLAELVDLDGRGAAAISEAAHLNVNAISDLMRRPTARWADHLVEAIAKELKTTRDYLIAGTVPTESVKRWLIPATSEKWPMWKRGYHVFTNGQDVDTGDYCLCHIDDDWERDLDLTHIYRVESIRKIRNAGDPSDLEEYRFSAELFDFTSGQIREVALPLCIKVTGISAE